MPLKPPRSHFPNPDSPSRGVPARLPRGDSTGGDGRLRARYGRQRTRRFSRCDQSECVYCIIIALRLRLFGVAIEYMRMRSCDCVVKDQVLRHPAMAALDALLVEQTNKVMSKSTQLPNFVEGVASFVYKRPPNFEAYSEENELIKIMRAQRAVNRNRL